jgi:hypothetical protein
MLEREETPPDVDVPDLPEGPAQEPVPEIFVFTLPGAPRVGPGPGASFETRPEPGEGLARCPKDYVAPLSPTFLHKSLLHLSEQHVVLGAVRPVAIGLQRPEYPPTSILKCPGETALSPEDLAERATLESNE